MSDDRDPPASPIEFLSRVGKKGVRAFGGSATPLGPPRHWPQGLRTGVPVVRTSRQPTWIARARELSHRWKRAFRSLLGARHPWALGQPTWRPTERRRVGDALQVGEALYRQLVQALPAAVYVCDAAGRIVLLNDEAAALWGNEHVLGEGITGAHYRMFGEDGTFLPPQQRPLARALRGETGLRGMEVVVERTDGERRNVIVYPQVIRDDAGRIVGGIKVMVDITERKIAEAALAAAKDGLALQVAAFTRLHDLATRLAGMPALESALGAVLRTLIEIAGADFGLLSLYDPEARRLRPVSSHGFTPEQLCRVECVEPGTGACGHALVTRSRTIVEDVREDPHFAPLREFAQDAGFRSVHSTPILDRDGGVLGVLSIHGRSPRRPSDLEVHFADMCARHAAATIELIRGQEALREADRRKDEFLATLAHELRNPLAPIRNAMHVIKLANGDPRAIEQARKVAERQLAHLVRLVDDLLDVSRIGCGKIELRRGDVDLGTVIRAAIETSDAVIRQHGHTLSLQLPDEAIAMHADEARLAQVFANLLNNAAKYTPRGGWIRLLAERQGPTAARIVVQDDGIGIPKDKLGSVFELYRQVDSSLERAGGGLGIGLTLVKRLVELHGGTIEARSDGDGKGSQFVVTLPARPAGTRPVAAERPPRVAANRPHVRLRILVVDDDADVAATLAQVLAMLGNDVRTANDGASAIEEVDRFAPQVIFLDIGMPGMNGYDVCRGIREREAGRDAVIVALSGWGQEQDRQRSMQAGMDLHLVKPIDPATLEGLLARLPSRASDDRDDAGGPVHQEGAQTAAPAPSAGAAQRAPGAPGSSVGMAEVPNISIAGRVPARNERASIDGLRFALFRRVAPALRHDLVGALQGIRFAVDLAQRQRRPASGESAPAEAADHVAEQAQEAMHSGDAIADWLLPDASRSTLVESTIDQCLATVRTDWSMRGIEVTRRVESPSRSVQGPALREVLTASLLALSDALETGADVDVAAVDDGAFVDLRVDVRVAERETFAPTPPSQPFDWDDVRALARANGVEWSRRGLAIAMRVPAALAQAA